LLDLFCGAGGASTGYHRAGFQVTGVDHTPQPHYPFHFVLGDALMFLAQYGPEYDVMTASPPCQAYSVTKSLHSSASHPALVEATREALQITGKPYVIENVVGAPLRWPLLLCGSMFGLQTRCGAQLRRHRLFESNLLLLSPGTCQHGATTIGVQGHEFRNEATRAAERRTIMVVGATSRDPAAEARKYKRGKHQCPRTGIGTVPQHPVVRNTIRETFSVAEARIAMGIDWMTMRELSQAIPPAYTEWIGCQLLMHLGLEMNREK